MIKRRSFDSLCQQTQYLVTLGEGVVDSTTSFGFHVMLRPKGESFQVQ